MAKKTFDQLYGQWPSTGKAAANLFAASTIYATRDRDDDRQETERDIVHSSSAQHSTAQHSTALHCAVARLKR